ncbi:MAG: YihA family ribosome biogenesis GTP-binding protein, partial [Lachnospiraceae bacterium]|nr:YihA family ribosome biogenesis GTP-binding protein [Lachnospiraceae bacterium]
MTVKNAELETVCGITSRFPVTEYAELAFAGRSNVGKSSLINSLLNRKNLARTSSEPGKTRTVNYYKVRCGCDTAEEDVYFYLVDLPGYGYARTSAAERAKWGPMIEKYLKKSATLKCVVLLVDIRHDPTADDRQMYDWIVSAGLTPLVIATKADKLKRSQIDKSIKNIKTVLKTEKDIKVLPYSAETKQGREELLGLIEGFICDI